MRLTGEWPRQVRERWGIRTLSPDEAVPKGSLWVSRCAETKRIACGTPRALYQSPLLDFFFRAVESAGVRYAVISDRYGLHFDDESLAWYDAHPSSLNAAQKRRLGRVIRAKALGRGYRTILFYNGSPVRSVPYFEMLGASRLEVWYTTRLHHVVNNAESASGV